MGSSLLLALVLNAVVSIRLAINGGFIVPLYLDEAPSALGVMGIRDYDGIRRWRQHLSEVLAAKADA